MTSSHRQLFGVSTMAATTAQLRVCLLAVFFICILMLARRQAEILSFSRSLRTWDPTRTNEAGHTRVSSMSVGEASLDDVGNATLGFAKIYALSLPSRHDRRDGIALQAAFTDLSIDFADGLDGASVTEKSLPKTKENVTAIQGGELGAWRGHANIWREIVQRNLGSALIMEDDSDWDLRIKKQFRDLALATRALVQPRVVPADEEEGDELAFDKLPETKPPTQSPYGDDWDIIWAGHCGQVFPKSRRPKKRVIQLGDETVPQKKWLWKPFYNPVTLKEKYPEHTRAYHHSEEAVCTLGYAVSQRGARKLLREVAMQTPVLPCDLLVRSFCEGTGGLGPGLCITTQPPLINSHWPRGPYRDQSNIRLEEPGFRKKAETRITRWSARINAGALLEGKDPIDGWPDEEA
ncbi:hypothetical protein CP532_5254 [Ophiocordyceps camponoti-leonardi (nom. inval.)]|nr:hypothetical protein CP532_5254 [Ophiocordyceps camponoti-leonardi (nom. inval.)]